MEKAYIFLENVLINNSKNPDIATIVGKTLTYSTDIYNKKRELSNDVKIERICNYMNILINAYKKNPDSKAETLDIIYDELLKLRDKI